MVLLKVLLGCSALMMLAVFLLNISEGRNPFGGMLIPFFFTCVFYGTIRSIRNDSGGS